MSAKTDPFAGVHAHLAAREDEEVISTFPVWTPDDWPRDPDDPTRSLSPHPGCQRGIVFLVIPKGADEREAMRTFLTDLLHLVDAPDEEASCRHTEKGLICQDDWCPVHGENGKAHG